MSDHLTAERLDQIRERAEAATDGPWFARTTGLAGGDHWYVCDAGEAVAHISANDGENEDQREPDAQFISHSRADIPALLERLDSMAKDLVDLKAALVEIRPAEVLVEGSFFAVADLPKILGNFMRSSNEYAAEAKRLAIRLEALGGGQE